MLNQPFPLLIAHKGIQDINFVTGATNRMTIKGTAAGATQGFVGIGNTISTTSPLFQLDVDDNTNLNINYNTTGAGFGYRINGDKLLSHPGFRNTFVGKNAGASWPVTNTYSFCTFVGQDAGPVNSGDGCTFVGDHSGVNNTAGTYNTFLGSYSGENNTFGRFNTFLGHHAGLNNTLGNNNTFVGYHSVGGTNICTGDNNTAVGVAVNGDLTTGSDNCMYGRTSGRSTTAGSGNCFYGTNSGFANTTGNNNLFMGTSAGSVNQTGSNNVILGRLANMLGGQTNLTNAIAIGSQAIVANSNNMILGNNSVNVGIGLSGVAVGPAKKLEINETGVATAIASNTSIPGTFGGSGLRFTKLTSATPTTASIGKVLTVNANGDVILVADQTSSVAPGSVFAQNGLSMVGTNTVELGGTLIHPLTVINFSTNTLQYKEASILRYQRDFTGTVYQLATGATGVGQPAGFSDNAIITNPAGGVGKLMQTYPAAPFASASAGLVGEEVLTYGTPISGSVGINGDVTGIISIAQNTASSTGNILAVSAWAQGASSASAAVNAGFFSQASGGPNNYGYYAYLSNGSASVTLDAGVYSDVTSNPNTNVTYGGYFNTSNGKTAYGVRATAQNGTSTNYGVFAKVPLGVAGSLNYGIWAEAPVTSATVGPYYAGYFNGDVVKTGADNFTSDQNLKQNIDTITNAIGIIKQLKPKTFDYKQSSYPSMSLPGGKQYGLIAQDVQPILPELVNTIHHPAKLDSLGNVITPSFTYLSLEYQQLTAIMIRAMQQQERRAEKQDSTIQAMQSQIAALTSSVTSCCSSSVVRTTKPSELNQLDINLSDKDIVVLNQNVPNPFAEQTTITYNVPEKYSFAQIIFSTVEGKIIKTVDITKKGKGQLNVFANDLSTGFYTYTLVVDGKTIDTKKMVKSE